MVVAGPMKLSQHRFLRCGIDVIDEKAVDAEKNGEVLNVKTLVIANPEQGETYLFAMDDEMRRDLIRKLTGGVHMAPSLKEPG